MYLSFKHSLHRRPGGDLTQDFYGICVLPRQATKVQVWNFLIGELSRRSKSFGIFQISDIQVMNMQSKLSASFQWSLSRTQYSKNLKMLTEYYGHSFLLSQTLATRIESQLLSCLVMFVGQLILLL